jgi:hypothetical protein
MAGSKRAGGFATSLPTAMRGATCHSAAGMDNRYIE